MISLIAAKSKNNVIGVKNDLPWHLSNDLKRFKDLTSGHAVVMGRKTMESIVGRLGRPLPNRHNIVLTRQNLELDGVQTVNSLDDLKFIDQEVFVIGGAEVYKQTIDIADKLYITEVQTEVDGDAFFPVVDMSQWHEISRKSHKKDDKNDYDYDFVVYARS